MSSEHLPLIHTDVQRTQTLHHPHSITIHHRQQRYLEGRNNGHTQIHDVLYTRFRHRLRSRTPQIQHKGTQHEQGNSLELQPIGSRDTNTELPHKTSYWITLLSSLHSAVKPAWRARQNTERLYELKGERTVDEHWRTPQREGTLNTRFHKSLSHTRQIYTETQPQGTAQLHTHSHSHRNTARVLTESQQQNTLRYKFS